VNVQSVRDKLIDLLKASDADPDGELRGDSALITSGKLDSLGLFNLALFVENEIGHQVDVTSFDLAAEWNTIEDILRFIARLRANS
jgi:acyl carrier protein